VYVPSIPIGLKVVDAAETTADVLVVLALTESTQVDSEANKKSSSHYFLLEIKDYLRFEGGITETLRVGGIVNEII